MTDEELAEALEEHLGWIERERPIHGVLVEAIVRLREGNQTSSDDDGEFWTAFDQAAKWFQEAMKRARSESGDEQRVGG